MPTLYANTFESYYQVREAAGLTPYTKVGETSRQDPMVRIKEQLGTSNPEHPILVGQWEVPFSDRDFHKFLKGKGYQNLEGPGKEWFALHPQELDGLVLEFSETFDSPYTAPRPEGHNTTISDIQFVSFCLRNVLWLESYGEMSELEKAILRLDEFGIFKSGLSSVKCALQLFVRDYYKRSDWELQEREGVYVYRVPCVGSREKFRFAICT
jgi:hypothetical protein